MPDIPEINLDDFLDPVPEQLPVVAMRDTIIYPNILFPILVGREASVSAVNEAMESGKYVLLLAQKNADQEKPVGEDLYEVGTVARIVQVMHLPNNLMKVLVNGVSAARVTELMEEGSFFRAGVEELKPETEAGPRKINALVRQLREKFEQYVMYNKDLPEEILLSFEQIEEPEQQLFFIASYLHLNLQDKQKLLEEQDLLKRFELVLTSLTGEVELQAVSSEIDDRVQDEIQKNQRRFYIQEQIKILQEELGEEEYGDPELMRFKEQIDELDLPDEVREKALEELNRLKKTPAMSPEHSVSRNYLDWLLNMPWGTYTDDNLDISKVEEALEQDHFGLEKPKERILEHIAVLNLVKEMKGQILCFVGPPGTGKTSLAKSISRAMGRNMERIALGGIHDEAEIRGHRKTYIGAMPGRIIQAVKRAGSMNPVIVLDEIDKVGSDHRGDPSSAILEVLDPEQNNTFNDHYLEVDFDLSRVMFITTANLAGNIQPALRDRMEIIQLPGYLEYDKLEIARRHLIPRQVKAHGIQPSRVIFKDEAIREIIQKYTREAGVRKLEQQIASICRKVAKKIVARRAKGGDLSQITINVKRVHELLGVEKYTDRGPERKDKIGSVNGLAWTSTGGSILQIDVARMPGKQKFTLTGQLGDVMKESAQAALTFIRSQNERFELPADFFDKNELHIHIPEGAIPKDGPSAGLAMTVAMISLLTNRPIRHDIAMTGEITLRGEVFAIGGLNEKLMAAQRNCMKTVLIPKDNERHLADISEKVKEGLDIIPVESVEESLDYVFADSAGS